MINKNSKTNGFTIAETLITLGIIGIIVSMTLPAIINSSKNKELEVLLNKNYSLLQQTLLRIYMEEGIAIVAENYTREDIKRLFINNIKGLRNCQGCGAVNEDNDNNTGTIYTISGYRTLNNKKVNANYLDDAILQFDDGRRLFIERPNQNADLPDGYGGGKDQFFISIDINGFQNRPNRWGADLFTFMVMPDGKLLPMGSKETKFSEDTYCSAASTSKYNGIGCTYKALTEKDYFKKIPK